MSSTSGATVVVSALAFEETLQTLIDGLGRRGVEIFGRIDHAESARAAGLDVNAKAVVVFGVAKAGTPLMPTNRPLGLDLPLRALVYEDGGGQIFIAYNAPGWMMPLRDLPPEALASLPGMTKLLETAVAEAAGGPPIS
jgi:uncharacterized protein (DUF302 family)